MYRNVFENDGRLKIIKNDRVYVLPDGWELDDAGSYDFSLKLQDRAFSNGSYAGGDGYVKGRTVKVSFDLKRESEKDHDEIVNEAYQAFAQRDYVLQTGRPDRCFKVAGISKLKHKYQKGFKQRWSEIEISLLLADPFRYATEQTVITTDFISDQKETEIIVNNPSSVDVPLIWSFAPTAGGSVPDITVLHVESGENFILKDTLLTAPAVAVVNGESGIVRRDAGNSINTFSGLFLKALPGSNTFKYTGAACRVAVAFTARWFV